LAAGFCPKNLAIAINNGFARLGGPWLVRLCFPIPLIPKGMTLNDLEWPFYFKLSFRPSMSGSCMWVTCLPGRISVIWTKIDP